MAPQLGLPTVGFNIFDDGWQAAQNAVASVPYWWAFTAGALLLILLIFGFLRKLVVFTIVVVAIAAAVGGLWIYTGHTIKLN